MDLDTLYYNLYVDCKLLCSIVEVWIVGIFRICKNYFNYFLFWAWVDWSKNYEFMNRAVTLSIFVIYVVTANWHLNTKILSTEKSNVGWKDICSLISIFLPYISNRDIWFNSLKLWTKTLRAFSTFLENFLD